MAKLTVVTEERLQYYNGKVAETYVEQVSGKQLSTNDYDNAEKQKVAGAVQETQLETKITDLGYAKSSEIPTDYVSESELESKNYATKDEIPTDYIPTSELSDLAKKSEIPTDYLTENDIEDFVTGDEVDQKITTANNKIGKVQGACTKADLATKKTTANNQDVWIVTDCDNHLYMFVGTGMPGADANGFMDLGDHIDVDGIVSQAQTGMVKEADLVEITTNTIDGWFA